MDVDYELEEPLRLQIEKGSQEYLDPEIKMRQFGNYEKKTGI